MNITHAIINTDLDGFLSGLLLHNFLGTEIVGFSDSGEYIWKKAGVTWTDCTFIDMFVVPKGIKTLCNHIIAVDDAHAKELFWDNHKENPNSDVATRSFKDSYTTKFSLATVHYIIAKLEQYDHDLTVINLKNIVRGQRCIDVILRADDVMNNTVHTYRENSLFWWGKMSELATTREQGLVTQSFMNYTDAIHKGVFDFNVVQHKKNFEFFVKSNFKCDSPDGGYKGLHFADSLIHEHAKAFVKFLSELTGLKPFPMEDELVVYKGQAHRASVTTDDLEDIREGKFRGSQLFSYAFVSRPSSQNHFSYTINLERI